MKFYKITQENTFLQHILHARFTKMVEVFDYKIGAVNRRIRAYLTLNPLPLLPLKAYFEKTVKFSVSFLFLL